MNERQIQQALHDLGWPITVDGAAGPQTAAAAKQFQRGFTFWTLTVDGKPGPATQNALSYSLAHGGACSPHFAFREFASTGNGWIELSRQLVRRLEAYRHAVGHGVRIVSGYRDPAHNAAAGGKPNSQHLYGTAADLDPVLSLHQVRALAVFSGIGVEAGSGLVRHVDVRGIGDAPATTSGTPSNPTVWYYDAAGNTP